MANPFRVDLTYASSPLATHLSAGNPATFPRRFWAEVVDLDEPAIGRRSLQSWTTHRSTAAPAPGHA